MSAPQKIRHALIIVFDYVSLRTKSKECIIDPPASLLAMDIDLENAYKIATESFQIERRNITIITDVIPRHSKPRPWGDLQLDGNNPRIVQLMYPEITQIIREIAQFVENTIRGIDDVVYKGVDKINEVMIYISCHGSRIPSIPDENNYVDVMDNALIFSTRTEGGIERRYLRDNDIFRLLFGHIHIEDDGTMLVPITRRTLLPGSPQDPRPYYLYMDDEACEFNLTPSSAYAKESKRKTYESKEDRGVPINTEMLMIIDSCHSGGMSEFHFVYDPTCGDMKPASHFNNAYRYPYCVSLAAAQNASEAPSTSNGSPFTRSLREIFEKMRCGISIKQLHELIYRTAPKILLVCKPTITSTYSNPSNIVPFMTKVHPCESVTLNE